MENLTAKVPDEAQRPAFLVGDVSGSVCNCEAHTFYEWEKAENKCSQCNKPILFCDECGDGSGWYGDELPPDEVDRLLVERLIRIRNFEGNRNDDMSYIDKTICYFLTEDEFQKYVIDKHEIVY